MQALKQQITIPDDHIVHFDINLPPDLPAGRAEVVLVIQPLSDEPTSEVSQAFSAVQISTSKFTFDRDDANER